MAPTVFVTLTYNKPGTEPPIFVAGSFSSWQPIEMDFSVEDGEYVFSKPIEVSQPSEIQYKFRIGHGDWWALDPKADAVTDSQGNVNSVIRLPINKKQDQDLEDDSGICPMFSHECFEHEHRQTQDAGDVPEPDSDDEESQPPLSPANRDSIMAAVRRLSTAIDHDGGNCPRFSHECFENPQPPNTSNASEPVIDYIEPQPELSPSSRNSLMAAMRRLSATIEPANNPIVEAQSPAGGLPAAPVSRASLHSIAEHDSESDLDEGIAMSNSPRKAPKPDDGTITPINASVDGAESPLTDVRERNLRKRTGNGRPVSPGSTHSLQEAHKDGSWFQAFVRTVFVDWIGGFVMWLCGGRNRAFLAAAGALCVGVGIAIR